MRPRAILLVATALCLATAPAAHAAAKQAIFDVTAKGHYFYDRVADTQPGTFCVAERGHTEDHKRLDVTFHMKMLIQTGFDRWYLNSVHQNVSQFRGKGKLADDVTSTHEANYGCDGPAPWQSDDRAEPNRSRHCTTTVGILARVDKNLATFYPGPLFKSRTKCLFEYDSSMNNPYFPTSLLPDLKVTQAKLNTRKLAGSSKAAVTAKLDKSKTLPPRVESDEPRSTTTINESYGAHWELTFKRKSPWRAWR
ncbi:MAG: hypothetical protein ACJ76V_03065 [Thermoleophilaceae bacterium]